MCVVCGCAPGAANAPHEHDHGHPHAHPHAHDHAHAPAPPASVAAVLPNGDLHYGAGAARVSVPGMSQARAIKLEADVLGENNRLAAQNRAHFAAHGVTAWNLVSSPGSGKTTLLCATIQALKARAPGLPVAVIEGDQQTSHDADRIRATGAPAIQVNTGKGCHLDAQMVGEAFGRLDLHGHAHGHDHDHDHAHSHAHSHDHDHAGPILFIENVGNLVCPAMWDLGEAGKVAILSVTEGEDKPIKYPDMFAAARLMILNKVDLLPHLDFDVAQCMDYARRVNPGIEVLLVSARTGTGMDAWLDWLLQAPTSAATAAPAAADPLAAELAAARARIAELEARLQSQG
ncbi:hydrogenase nickel incorporation protein HypB [Ideonella livida]|uniref:Hydrogenase maturation factor HypB n=1 Tax=Ideonella livida TaxID=2707176 RepID=A0A7C9THW3_9BURK|nr:hydrogenase nickel incorporation protein HypB [Ideonella livida]NDY89803.1 hydrogenase nickel incorporation protein HypB [Ideonella livida]